MRLALKAKRRMDSLESEIKKVFSKEGPLARRLTTWEERPEQQALALGIGEALEAEEPFVAEAGTGVGKSFAYLLPTLLRAEREHETILITTRTKALQDQLDRKDLPFLQSVLPVEFTWAIGLGRNNYLCLRRMHRSIRESSSLFPDLEDGDQLRRIQQHSSNPAWDGTRGSLPFLPQAKVWQEVQAEHGNCLGRNCPHFEPCHFQKGRRRLQHSRVVVVNHSLFFADLALRSQGVKLLPDYSMVVFDEAHHLEDIAADAMGLRLSPGAIDWHLGRLWSRRRKSGLFSSGDGADLAPSVENLHHLADDWWASLEIRFAEALRHNKEVRLHPGETIDLELAGALQGLAGEMQNRARLMEDIDVQMEWTARADQLQGLVEICQSFARRATDNEVRWVEREKRGVSLHSAPIRVDELLRKNLFTQVPRAILVSATLGPPKNKFAWIRGRLGLDEARALHLGSPFPYEQNVKLEIEEGLPDPGHPDFAGEASRSILRHCLENEGRALVLCTSWRFLKRVTQSLREPLQAKGIELLVQGEAPLRDLLDRKREEPRSVLVGTDSLWEGIDIPGDALTLVLLTRFPFPVPSQPLAQARTEQIEREGGSGFFDYSLPRAVVKFRQGFGRLVRRGTDEGKIVILDPRILRKSYGRAFLSALPKCK